MINPANMFKLKKSWDTFTANHPKFPAFLNAASQGMMQEGTIIDIEITAPDGRKVATKVKLTESDLELFREIGGMK